MNWWTLVLVAPAFVAGVYAGVIAVGLYTTRGFTRQHPAYPESPTSWYPPKLRRRTIPPAGDNP